MFARSLLLTRLLFGVYVLVPSPRHLKLMNSVYMVILRRIADEPRFRRVEHTDRQIRELLDQPAIECLISRMRLLYCAKLERVRPAALMAILHARPKGRCLPWVRQLASDTELLRGLLPADFPSLFEGPDAWRNLMLDEAGWKNLVHRVHFIESVCDTKAVSPGERALAHECHCGKAFATMKALESHQRAQHGTRLDIQDYLPSSSCPACGKDFQERLRLISHLSDRRRPKCREWIKAHCSRLPAEKAVELRNADCVLRRKAQQNGHSHHLAVLPVLHAKQVFTP